MLNPLKHLLSMYVYIVLYFAQQLFVPLIKDTYPEIDINWRVAQLVVVTF